VQISTLERELLAVREYNAVLDLEVPSPAEQTTMLAKLSARQGGRVGEEESEEGYKWERENSGEGRGRGNDDMMTKGPIKSGRIKRGSVKEREKHGRDQQSVSRTDEDGSERGGVEGTRKSGKD
jgi:hypothetical protein